MNRVAELHAPAGALADPGADGKDIIVSRGRAKTQVGINDRQADAGFFQLTIRYPPFTHVLRPSELAPDEIDRVVRHAHLVRFGIANTDVRGRNGACIGIHGAVAILG